MQKIRFAGVKTGRPSLNKNPLLIANGLVADVFRV